MHFKIQKVKIFRAKRKTKLMIHIIVSRNKLWVMHKTTLKHITSVQLFILLKQKKKINQIK